MKVRRYFVAIVMVFVIFTSACQPGLVGNNLSEKTSTIPAAGITEAPIPTGIPKLSPTEIPPPIPTKVDYSTVIKDFAGKWIGYSVTPLDPKKPDLGKPGMRLEIAVDRFAVDGLSCENPKYASKTVSLKEYLAGYNEPDMSFELNQDEFPLLQSGCSGMEPSNVALVNPRTLTAIMGSDILYFELDSGVSRNGLTINTDLVSESNKDPLYEMHAQVPQLDLPNTENFNKIARSIVDGELTGFKKNFLDWRIPAEMAAATSFMWIGYDVPLLTPDLVCIRFTVDYYMAGAAHPNHYFRVINYDLETKKEIKLSDLFKNSNKAINVFAIATKKSLSKPDFPIFEEGMLPKKENFANWNLTPEGLRLSFDPYQVAPYAAGAQEVLVPYHDIRDLVNTDTTAGKFVINN
jgi:hypothetical protein